MTPMDAVLELSSLSLGSGFWQPYRFLSDNEIVLGDFLQRMSSISAGLVVLFLLLEILRLEKKALQGQSLSSSYARFVFAALLGVFLTAPGLYFFGVRLCVETASSLSQALANTDLDAMSVEVQNLMKGILASTQDPVSLFTGLLELLTPLGLLTVAAYYLVIALLYALPYVQSMFLAVFVLLGPLLLPFALWSPTRGVAKKWFMSLLSCAFLSVFGMVAYTAISVSGILTNLAMAGDKHIPSLVFSFTTIAFLLSVVWSSFRVFGALSLSMKHGVGLIAKPLRKIGVM